MNTMSLKYFYTAVLLMLCKLVPAQVFNNQMSLLDKINVYKVVTFEEFVNRFNNDPKSNIKKAYKYYHVEFKIRRPALIKSLFDYETASWDTVAINSFTAEALDAKKSKPLNAATGLFAEVKCRFRYHSADAELPLILRYISDPQKGSKWVICGVGVHSLALNDVTVPKIKENMTAKFITPVNNEINFTELEKVFSDKNNLHDYFDKEFFLKKRAVAFYNAVVQNQVQFLDVKDIYYHELQYEGWIFIVKEFRRNTLNSGWLISKLIKTLPEAKAQYLENLLGEQL